MLQLPLILSFIYLMQAVGIDPGSNSPVIERDICVYGGSEAGFTAAIQIARLGKTVVLIEPTGHAGGMAVEGISGDIRFASSAVIGGIARELYTMIEAYYGRNPRFGTPGWRSYYEPHVSEMMIDSLLAAENITIVRGKRLKEGVKGVLKEGTRLTHILLEDGTPIQANIFIDASIEGHLLHFAGVETETIREGNALYNETKNGIRTVNTYRQFEVEVDPYIIPGEPKSGLIKTIQDQPLGKEGAPDRHIQGFCFRLCLTNTPENRITISQPENYQPKDYEIYRRYLAVGGMLFSPNGNLPNNKTDLVVGMICRPISMEKMPITPLAIMLRRRVSLSITKILRRD